MYISGNTTFPIVGIGASAGGLEALEQFLSSVPDTSGMAYAVVQHLDPTHKGLLPELLQRNTHMKVMQVKQHTKVQPDCVYVIPPNKDMSISNGEFNLMAPAAPRGLRLPIDLFFRSLALNSGQLSIGVILSGMGSDGVLGLQAIKEAAGIVLVQDPATAKCEGMPRSAIDTGLVDIVAPAEELPAKIMAFLERTNQDSSQALLNNKDKNSLGDIIVLLRAHTGHDFSLYKKNSICRRLERRMGIHQITSIKGYIQYMKDNPQELELLFKELLIGVTSFFRDVTSWDYLKNYALPALFERRHNSRELRAWIPGCSTGEEAYSLAMVFQEAAQKLVPQWHYRLQIFATDLAQESIEKARQGIYSENIVADVSPERLERFFVLENGKYRITKEIREMVIFAQQDMVMDPPFTKLDILICRNLLIYLEGDLQKKLMPLFHYSLKTGGLLFLGSAETVGNFTNLFGAEDDKFRIYRRLEPFFKTSPVEFPPSFVPVIAEASQDHEHPSETLNVQSLTDQIILQQYSPPAVLTNASGDVVYISGRTGKYLEPAAGKANLNIFAMARDGLRSELSAAFNKAVRETATIEVKGLMVAANHGDQRVDIIVQALGKTIAAQGMVLIVFRDVYLQPAVAESQPTSDAESQRISGYERELQRLHAELGVVREEMQTSQEKLRSTNEELQSTNEELTTSKEETQSMNEELQTLNAELQAKLDELSLTASDMKNLLDSTDIATVFLDRDLKVRRFTSCAAKIIKFIPGDVGRPLTDLTSILDYPELAENAREVLRTLVFSEKQIHSQDGRWFSVRIMPYRTIEEKIDGVVITLADITSHHKEIADLQTKFQEDTS